MKYWGMLLVCVAGLCLGCAAPPQASKNLDRETALRCPCCQTNWMGKDNGYGSAHYMNEIGFAADGYRTGVISEQEAFGRLSQLQGNREQFWHGFRSGGTR